MRRKRFYLTTVLLAMAMFTIPTACSDDSEESAESLAKKYCDCNKIESVDQREKCFDNVNYQLQFHLNDATFMAAYTAASRSCSR